MTDLGFVCSRKAGFDDSGPVVDDNRLIQHCRHLPFLLALLARSTLPALQLSAVGFVFAIKAETRGQMLGTVHTPYIDQGSRSTYAASFPSATAQPQQSTVTAAVQCEVDDASCITESCGDASHDV